MADFPAAEKVSSGQGLVPVITAVTRTFGVHSSASLRESNMKIPTIQHSISMASPSGKPANTFTKVTFPDGGTCVVADAVPVEAVEGLLKKLLTRKARLDRLDAQAKS